MGKLGVVVVAGGKGTRMRTSESKQYLPLGGKPVVVRTLEAFQRLDEAEAVVLVVGAGEERRNREFIGRYGLTKVTDVVAGGKERQHSVYNGLQRLDDAIEWVLVHDAVRPFVQREHVLACWSKARDTGAAVLAVPVKDTIKVVDADGIIRSTPDRRSLWAMQTPQAFRRSLLMEAYEAAERDGFVGTDDAMLVERLGKAVHVVEGSSDNIKLTTPEDLRWAEWYVQNGGGRDRA